MSAIVWGHRMAQGMRALSLLMRSVDPPEVGDLLTPAQRAAFHALPAFDRAHLASVLSWLRAAGETDPDVLQAALLHDIGKHADGHRVMLIHRALNVLLERYAPGALARLAHLPAPWWRAGLALAVHHPRLGAEMAAELGCSPRTCWLIAHHEDDPLPDDPHLLRLVEADQAA
jgi:hypothetical protein